MSFNCGLALDALRRATALKLVLAAFFFSS